MEFKVERTASETPYTNLENRSSDIQLPEVRELTLKQKTDTSQGLQKQTRVNTFLAKMALFFQSNGKRGESVNSYINGLTQFYKLAGLYRIMTAAERKAIKDLVSADKYASPVINYLDAFASLNQDAFLRVLAEMFAQDNPKLIGKTMKSEDVERMLQVVRLGEDNMNTSSDFERSLCTDPGLSATST